MTRHPVGHAVLAAVLVAMPVAVGGQQARLIAADGKEGERFGAAVALSDDIALVGAPLADVGENPGQGAAYVFTRDGGTWKLQARLIAEDGKAHDQFGWSVALTADTALVGALAADVGGDDSRGAAYVFTRDGDTWSPQAKLIADDGEADNRFGWSVDLSGNTALVGAALADGGDRPGQGAAYVFTRRGDKWRQQATLTPADGAAGDRFGVSVALSGDTALVGARFAVVDDKLEQGAAYVFDRGSDGGWRQQGKLTASDGVELDGFGVSVALSGDTALVGADGADTGEADQGAAYVFTHDGGVWSQRTKLTADDGAAGDAFGVSVALAGDTALVGANVAAVNGDAKQGAAYVFTRGFKGWGQRNKLTVGDGAELDGLGVSLALSGHSVLLGAQDADVGDTLHQGAAYVFAVKDPPPVGPPS